MEKQKFIIWFKDLGIKNVPQVGGKNASLGEMYTQLAKLGVPVPNGFATTSKAYKYLLSHTHLMKEVKNILRGLNTHNTSDLQKRGRAVRNAVLKTPLPKDLEAEILSCYKEMEKMYGKNVDVAVRSSATAEDLPGASFAGQHETFLNVRGKEHLLKAVKGCYASLFTDRAISYRVDKGFSHFDVALSVGVQKMVRTDLASSGVAFTIDTESGFNKIVMINSAYGLGEMVVQGKVTPDEFLVFKPTLAKEKNAIIGRTIGAKVEKMIYAKEGIKKVKNTPADREKYSLTDKEVLKLAKWCIEIEKHFSKKYKHYQPMDIEWGKDGKTGDLFIVQARPETVHSMESANISKEYVLKAKKQTSILNGIPVGAKIASGKVNIIKNVKKINTFKKGQILVTEITDPDWEPIMKIASGIITEKGGRTSHAAIVSRELGIPALVGAAGALKTLKNGQEITMDCSSGTIGKVYRGKIPFKVVEHKLGKLPETKTKIMVNIGSPDEAFKNHYLPVKGVGLGRLEFIINDYIKAHPNALIDYPKLKRSKNPKAKHIIKEIDKLTTGYKNKSQFYVDQLAEGVAKIAATFYPNDVIIRFSDFKTNEYSKLLGGELYEPKEENPMIGWRGSSRYYDDNFKRAFALEVKALKKVREEMGLDNVVPMVPFCRTVEEGKKVLEAMEKNGLKRKKGSSLKIYVMCEIPSNVLLADDYLKIFDGMSIGSNDLTQLILGMDRDSSIISHIGNEKNMAVKKMVMETIARCRAHKKYSGICGQAPSDYPEFAEFLVERGITSISLNPDTVIKTLMVVANKEKKLKRK